MSHSVLHELVSAAIDHHQAGRLHQAEPLYREILSRDDQAAPIWHLLGVLQLQQGTLDEAERHIRRAIELDAGDADFHSNLGMCYLHQGRHEAAVGAFRQALELDPQHLDAWVSMGNTLRAAGRPHEARDCYERALQIDPEHVDAASNLGATHRILGDAETAVTHLVPYARRFPGHVPLLVNLANALRDSGRLAEAATHYQAAVQREPEDVELWVQWADCLQKLQREPEAENAYRRALELNPRHARANNDLGIICFQSGRAEEARDLFQQAIDVRSDFYEAILNLGAALRKLGALTDAVLVFERAHHLRPAAIDPRYQCGLCYLSLGLLHRALDEFQAVLQLDPQYTRAYERLVRLLPRLGRPDLAKMLAEQWVEHDPDNPAAQHFLAACTDAPAPPRASDDYVRSEFDHFAQDFDEKLSDLGYRAPQLLHEALTKTLDEPRELNILDAGCGTGLCGPLLRPWAQLLAGVDLSPGMLQRAAQRGDYDELVEAELTSFLQQHRGGFDLLVAADTLCYFGDLSDVLQASWQALRAGGHLAATLEALPDSAEVTYQLHSHGRYSHHAQYVRDLLEASGFELLHWERDQLRSEYTEPVIGFVFVARKLDAV